MIPEAINSEAVESVEVVPVSLAPLMGLSQGGYLTVTALNFDALDLSGQRLEYDQYEALGTALGAFDRACRFWIGDWLIYGERTYDADRYAQAAAHTGLSERTLANRAWLCRAIPPHRRRALVPYSCHVLVAPLKPREQTKWLKWAEEHRATVAELRAAMRAAAEVEVAPAGDVRPAAAAADGALPGPAAAREGVDMGLLVEAAVNLVKHARIAGENVMIRREDYSRLLAALGEEDDEG